MLILEEKGKEEDEKNKEEVARLGLDWARMGLIGVSCLYCYARLVIDMG